MLTEFPASELKARQSRLRKCFSHNASIRKKDPAAVKLPGPQAFQVNKPRMHQAHHWALRKHLPRHGKIRSAKRPSPIERMRPGPVHLGFVEPIARLDEILSVVSETMLSHWVGCSESGGYFSAFSATCRDTLTYKSYAECKETKVFLGWDNNRAWWYCA